MESIVPLPEYFYPSGYPSYLIRRTYTYVSRLLVGGGSGLRLPGRLLLQKISLVNYVHSPFKTRLSHSLHAV
eukprot:2378951-Pleurochrysis_carterae.AAC.1